MATWLARSSAQLAAARPSTSPHCAPVAARPHHRSGGWRRGYLPTACELKQWTPRIPTTAAGASGLLNRELADDESEQWEVSAATLSDALGLDLAEANKLLARAFGWTTQAFWRREKVEELPSSEQVDCVLSFLGDELGLAPEERLQVVRAFPEVLACDPDSRLRANASQLMTQWRLQGPTLAKAVLRQPQVLGYSVDCGGDCVGECNRCWVRF